MATINQILRPKFLTRVVSQQAATSDWLLNLFGCQPGGPSELNFGHGREGAFQIYNHVRKVGALRAPGTSANRRDPQATGRVPFTYPRMHDSVTMLAETIHNISQIENTAVRDTAGEQYIARQTRTLSELAVNFRKVMLAGALRGSLYAARDNSGSSYLSFSSATGASEIKFGMPAGNKGQLDMLGGGDIIDASWATAATDIPGHILSINAAFQQLCGGGLRHIILPSKQWQNVLNNDNVQAYHGTAGPAFQTLTMDQLDPSVGNTSLNVQVARLNFCPWVNIWITDEGFDLGAPGSESFTKMVGDDDAVFIGCNPQDDTISCYLGSEPIAEYDGGPKTVKTGLASWSAEVSNPTRTELFALDNALVVNHVPSSVAYGTVEFT